jgi:hypothetical protein
MAEMRTCKTTLVLQNGWSASNIFETECLSTMQFIQVRTVFCVSNSHMQSGDKMKYIWISYRD